MICYACQAERSTYSCTRCKDTGPREDFQKTNFERDHERGSLQCLECKEGRKKGKVCIVDDCKKFISHNNLSETHKINASRPFVCEPCTKNGYSTKDTKTYVCANCKKVAGGHGLFQSKNFQQAAKRGTQRCKGCAK